MLSIGGEVAVTKKLYYLGPSTEYTVSELAPSQFLAVKFCQLVTPQHPTLC